MDFLNAFIFLFFRLLLLLIIIEFDFCEWSTEAYL